ncbi:hypothetical protein MP638_001866 [Amoeboaphelidium occidentale]|nr:hypothetical protein MP638_001866 [Amoeboaphelidium occidentale]
MASNALWIKTERLIESMKAQIAEVYVPSEMDAEADGDPGNANNNKITKVSASFTTLKRLISELQELNQREMDMDKRNENKARLQSFHGEYGYFQRELDKYRKKREEKIQLQRERNALLNQSSDISTTQGGSLYNRSNAASNSGTMLSAQERIDASLQRSQIETSHMIDMGVASLQKLREQGMTLKNAHRKMLDIANQLGLSQTTIRWIERRSLEDMYIFWAGVIITLGIMAYFLFFR